MPASLDAALSGMLEQQRKIESIANNIANVNTTGYKRLTVHFQDVLNTADILAAVNGEMLPGEASTSGGVAAGVAERSFAQGPLIASPEPLDIAIVGAGFFRLRLPDGATALLELGGDGAVASAFGTPASSTAGVYALATTAAGSVTLTFTPDDGSAPTTTAATVAASEVNTTLIPGLTITFADPLPAGVDSIRVTSTAYARDGAFRMDASRQLVTQLGVPLDATMTFPEVFSDVRVLRDGTVVVHRPYTDAELAALGPNDPRDGVDEVVGRIPLTGFDNPDGLASIGNSLYVATTASPPADGFPDEAGLGNLVGGFLEGSNVEVADEMTSLLVASRVYQMNLAAYRTIQEMLAQANELV